ncbi:hypothetical protein CALVIDRAFT_77273 [Calocera viscosa TUFC12733]|uniref:P-loop containing nucleoside triphosphate hydrolase protein n=1 Tax=Calocera viscosa (strain TUFC12733) TaxID=1330018 RepID=A0A167NEY0_CALVF|nr:hypothetical protein CALVIDRAFT_77273 [Calocera viscosa TUFC12733]
MSYTPHQHPHLHPYATASRASPSRPPPTSSSNTTSNGANGLQSSSSQRRRSTSLPYHSHAPLGPPTAPPRIPLPDVPRETLGLDEWPPRPLVAADPDRQLLGPGIPQGITHSRSLPGTAGPEGRFPPLNEAEEDLDLDLVGRTRSSTDSGHSYLSSPSLSRPSSRASGRITPLPMRRYSTTGSSAGAAQGERRRSKSRSRATSDADGSTSTSTYGTGSPLLPSIALDPPTLEERERQRALERERTRQPSRTRQMVNTFIGSLNAHAHSHNYSSSNPTNTPAPVAARKGAESPTTTKPMRTSPSLPHFPQHAGEEYADPQGPVPVPVSVRRKMSGPRVDTSAQSLQRRPSVGLLGLSGRDVAIMAPGVVEESHGRARSNSKATLSGRDTPGSLTKLLPDPFPLAPSPNDGSAEHPYHIAVIGARRCGKTTFILMGLEGWWHIKRVTEVADKEGEVRYQVRASKIGMVMPEPGQQAPEVHYRILEVDSKQVDWEMDAPPAWPAWMPHVDGAFVLFDSTNRRNAYVAPAVDLIRDMNIPCIVVATKTDQAEAFPIARMDQRTRTRDVGLVGSSSDPTHKNRVAPKHCFRYLCKVVTGSEMRELVLLLVLCSDPLPRALLAGRV